MDRSKKSKELDFKLREIIRDENKKLSLQELEQFIFELRNDSRDLYTQAFLKLVEPTPLKKDYQDVGFYDGEANAFQIVLDLLQHLDDIRKTDND